MKGGERKKSEESRGKERGREERMEKRTEGDDERGVGGWERRMRGESRTER